MLQPLSLHHDIFSELKTSILPNVMSGVVEMMAAGVITIAHDSGGPKFDIIKINPRSRTGYLASTAEQYADAMADVIGQYHVPEMRSINDDMPLS